MRVLLDALGLGVVDARRQKKAWDRRRAITRYSSCTHATCCMVPGTWDTW